MFETELEKVEEIKRNRAFVVPIWTVGKLAIAYFLIAYLDYGIYVVFGYILYSMESQSGLVFLNSQETNYHINQLYNRDSVELAELKKEISNLKELLEDYELRLEVMESNF